MYRFSIFRRYAKDYLTNARKKRIDQAWIESSLSPYRPKDKKLDAQEEKQLNKLMESTPMPTTVSAFKNHPLYALPRLEMFFLF